MCSATVHLSVFLPCLRPAWPSRPCLHLTPHCMTLPAASWVSHDVVSKMGADTSRAKYRHSVRHQLRPSTPRARCMCAAFFIQKPPANHGGKGEWNGGNGDVWKGVADCTKCSPDEPLHHPSYDLEVSNGYVISRLSFSIHINFLNAAFSWPLRRHSACTRTYIARRRVRVTSHAYSTARSRVTQAWARLAHLYNLYKYMKCRFRPASATLAIGAAVATRLCARLPPDWHSLLTPRSLQPHPSSSSSSYGRTDCHPPMSLHNHVLIFSPNRRSALTSIQPVVPPCRI